MEELTNHMRVAVYQKAKKGKYYCGDSYYYKETENTFLCALADGLGSGEMAHESSQAVMEVIEQHPTLTIEAIVKKCNEALTGKRGVVLGLLRVDYQRQTYSYASIGNIGVITIDQDGKRHRSIPLAGYLAGFPRKLRVASGIIRKGTKFLMFSDGVNDRLLTANYTRVNVTSIVEQYKEQYGQMRDDDTTLIGMEYE